MLKGLEATEVRFLSLKSIIDYRIEAEYFLKKFLENETILEAIPCIPFVKCFIFQNGRPYNSESFGAFKGNEYVSVAKIGDVTNKRDRDLWELIPYEEFILQKGTLLKYGDILMTLTGDPPDVGKVHFCYETMENATWNQRVAKINIKNKEYISNPEYGYVLLSSDYCRCQLERYAKGIRQRNLGNEGLNKMLLPQLSKGLQDEVQQVVKAGFKKYSEFKEIYSSAENYLLECLGMQDFAVNPDAYNVKTLKESFLESGRIDAEYYLPKYEDYIKAVSAYAGGVAPLGEVCTIKDSNYTPEHGMKYRYIELANIGKSGDITGCTYENGEDLPTRARRIVTQGDVIVSSIEGSLSSCALITDDYDQSLCSTGFYVVRSSQINSETLLTLFKSFPIQQLLKKGCSGTILTGIGKQEFENIPIPLIRPEVQEEIAQHVRQSFALRKEASQLLEKAKLSVEHAIEMAGGGKLLIYNNLQNKSVRQERLAMWLLLKELGIMDDTQKQQRAVVTDKCLSQSFLASGRLDAEYYQPKYDYLDTQLAEIPTKRLGDVVNIQKSIEPGSEAYQDEGVPFVRVADLSKFGLDNPSVRLDRKAFATALRPKKDTILMSKDGSVGIAYKIDEDADVITSGAILHLSVKVEDILPDYLTLLLNSPIVRMQAERDAGGSIIQHWKPSEIAQVVIPILPAHIQQKLSERVSKSFALRRESKTLLDEAKLMVEQAIEHLA